MLGVTAHRPDGADAHSANECYQGTHLELVATHGPEMPGDLPNSTNVEPVIQISEVAVEGQPLA